MSGFSQASAVLSATGPLRNDTGTKVSDIEPNPEISTETLRGDTGANIDRLFRMDGKTKRRRKRVETQFSEAEYQSFMKICKHYGASSAAVLRVALKAAESQFDSGIKAES